MGLPTLMPPLKFIIGQDANFYKTSIKIDESFAIELIMDDITF